ncbi:hypothetical protein [Azospirillum sp.]|uniref:hypothetical protein n=1 Tax=Azospirillum sp. TaxID=34012 RepID=UPI002D691DAE|nr:hypothetical protein [Azospirillum sp.]HYD63863.1 hypothetical protein [Azospirillum sp.]
MTEPILYEAAVAEFEAGLLDAVRGHATSHGALEMWVPDEDPVRSLLNMAESAESCGASEIAVDVRRATLPADRDAELLALLAELGTAAIEPEGDGVVVRVTGLGAAAAVHGVHPSLREGIQRRLSAPTHEGPLPEAAGCLRLGAVEGDIALSILVDPTGRTVTAARHGGAANPVERAILDALCAEIEGTPVADAAEHGLVRVLGALHDPDKGRPVPGILHPGNADPAFASALRLIRALRDRYEEKAGAPQSYNEFDRPPTDAWRALGDAERLGRVTAAVAAFPPGAMRVLGLEPDLHGHPVRAVVGFADGIAAAEKPGLMRALERHLKRTVERSLQTHHAALKDQNAIRRL